MKIRRLNESGGYDLMPLTAFGGEEEDTGEKPLCFSRRFKMFVDAVFFGALLVIMLYSLYALVVTFWLQ